MKKMRNYKKTSTLKKIQAIICCICLMVLGTGCNTGSETETQPELEEGQVNIYYLSNATCTLENRVYNMTTTDVDSMIKELFNKLVEKPNDIGLKSAVPEEVELLSYRIENKLLTMFFSDEYYDMSSIDEVLCRAAVVKTLMQIDGISGIEFVISNQPLVDKAGYTVGLMTKDTFVDNMGSDIDSFQKTELNLYFSNMEGTGLVLVRRTLSYNTNISIEKLIVEQLLKGVDSKDGLGVVKSALPSNARLLSLYVKDSVCYVNFDENFVNQTTNVEEEVMIYSLVNSLTELSSITKVQISINGNSNRVFREKVNLNTMFERNEKYIIQ